MSLLTLARSWAVALSLTACAQALAHEFWMMPSNFDVPPGSTAEVTLFVGQQFSGEQVGISTALVSALRLHTARGASDVRGVVPASPVGSLGIAIRGTGTQILALDTHPSAITLPADKFNAYLELEGLTSILAARQQAGSSASPARERYRRNIKTLLHGGGRADGTFAARTGQRLEIVPQRDPTRLAAGQSATLRLYFDGRPLAGALVKLWRRGTGDVEASGRTDAAGRVALPVSGPGVWMLSTVHMIPAKDTSEFDWDSYWGNLTFELKAPG